MYVLKTLALCFLISTLANSQEADEKKKVLAVVQYFFDALEKQDTIALRNLFLKEAMNYYVQEREDSVITVSQSSLQIGFSKDRVIVERMRPSAVIVHMRQRIAAAWVPYDLWINGTFSHCGVDVFAMIKTSDGWKISSLSFTREFSGCDM
jgi:hypothetical protein